MWECRHCGEFIPGPREKLPSRCPNCREPLFERSGGPTIIADDLASVQDQPRCALHPENVSMGCCRRCGRPFCPVCRTRWRDTILCFRCVEAYLLGREIAPEEHADHFRLAFYSCLFGGGAWVCLGLAITTAIAAADGSFGLLALTVTLAVIAVANGTIGLGQATEAVRLRGHRLTTAMTGLILSATSLALCLGFVLIQGIRV